MSQVKIFILGLLTLPLVFGIVNVLSFGLLAPVPFIYLGWLVYMFVRAGAPQQGDADTKEDIKEAADPNTIPAWVYDGIEFAMDGSRAYPNMDLEKNPHYRHYHHYEVEPATDGEGLTVSLTPTPGKSGSDLTKMGDAISAQLGMPYVEIDEIKTTGITFTLRHSAPAELDFSDTIMYDEVAGTPVNIKTIPLGKDKAGEVVSVPVFENHFLIGGSTGSGKSFAATNLFLGLGQLDNVVMYGIDAKGGIEMAAWRPRFSSIAETRDQALTMLEAVYDEMMRRNRRLKPQGKLKVDPTDPSTPIIFVAIDEAAELLDGAKDKDEKEVQETLYKYLISIAQLGRSAGIVLLVMTQSPYSNIIRSTLRNNLTIRFGLRTATEEQGVTILGERYPTMPSHITATEKGAGVLLAPGYAEPLKVKTFFITEQDRARKAKALAVHKPTYQIPGVAKIVWTQWGEFVEAYVKDGELSAKNSQIIKKDPMDWSAMDDEGVKWFYEMIGGGGTIQGLVADLLPNGMDDVDKIILGMEGRIM